MYPFDDKNATLTILVQLYHASPPGFFRVNLFSTSHHIPGLPMVYLPLFTFRGSRAIHPPSTAILALSSWLLILTLHPQLYVLGGTLHLDSIEIRLRLPIEWQGGVRGARGRGRSRSSLLITDTSPQCR